MPRDLVTFPEIEPAPLLETDGVLQRLIEARQLLSDPARWAKGDYCVGDAFCALGAVGMRRWELRDGMWIRHHSDVAQATGLFLHNLLGHGMAPLPTFNDDPTTTHADVLALFDRAIAKRRADIAGG